MTGWIIETLIASTLLMAAVLLVRQRVAALFGPRIAYLLWLLPALRMVLPPLPASLGAPSIAHEIGTALPAVLDLSLLQSAGAAPTAAESGINWMMVVLVLWLTGAALHFAVHLVAYRRFLRFMLRDATPLPGMDRDGIEVCSSPHASGPFAAGIFVKTIVLPNDYRKRYDHDELRLAMKHELEHHRRCDMSANLAALTMMSLHWFNPVAYRAHRAFRIDQELACDARVLGDATSGDRHAYASALVKSATRRVPAAVCAIGTKDQLKQRLRMMGGDDPTAGRVRTGMAMVALMMTGGLALTASGGFAAEATKDMSRQVEDHVATTILTSPVLEEIEAKATREASRATDRRIAELPTPPAPPPPPAAPYPPAPPAPPAIGSIVPPPPPPLPPNPPEVIEQARRGEHGAHVQSMRAHMQAEHAMIDASAQVRAGTALATAYSGVDVNALVVDALQQARAEIQSSTGMDGQQRTHAIATLDRKIADFRESARR